MAIAFCKGKYNVGVAELRVTGCWLLVTGRYFSSSCPFSLLVTLLSATNTFNGRDIEHYTIEHSFFFFLEMNKMTCDSIKTYEFEI